MRFVTLIGGLLLFALAPLARSQDGMRCDPLEVTAQTYDVNDSRVAPSVRMVEANHFTPDVEQHLRGQTAPLPLDIAFVLRYIPNHYRALTSMASWQLQHAVPVEMQDRVWPVDCYFQRAFSYRPKDNVLHFVYAVYLHKAKRYVDADREYDAAQELGADNADLYYNRGLLAVDMGKIKEAEQYAEKAYALGYPLPGLKNKIARAKTASSAGAKKNK